MQASQTPTRIPLAFAANGSKNAIPTASQIAVTPGAASLNDGFPPLTMTPVAAGGVPPSGQDFNGILNLISQTTRWQNAGGLFVYNSAFASDSNVGGYPRGALLLRSDQSGAWLNQTDNNTSNPDTGGAGWAAAFMSGTVGQARNVAMSINAASATATLTADEVVVASALGGHKYVLSNFNQTVNLATTGPGGIDYAGTVPASGFLALYAIYNPSTGARQLVAQGANVLLPEVYSNGAAIPSLGYTVSALLAIVPTTASSQFQVCTVADRTVTIPGTLMFSASATASTPTTVNNLGVPLNAKFCSGWMQAGSSAAGAIGMGLYASNSTLSLGAKTMAVTIAAGSSLAVPFERLRITVGQRTYYTASSGGGTSTFNATVNQYEF